MCNYDTHHYDNEKLKESATFLATLKLNPITDLEQVRRTIGEHVAENPSVPRLADWCFLDGKYRAFTHSCPPPRWVDVIARRAGNC